MSTMLSPDSLQPPKMGSSRWSKALPEVPGIDFDDIYSQYEDEPAPAPENKDLPRLPIPPPPPRSTSMANARPLNPSLPQLPLINTSLGPPSLPPPMAIPRRPVGKAPSHLPQQPKPQEPPSPSQSISSILSAYSKASGESLIQSTDAATNKPESEANMSPTRQALPANTTIETYSSPTQLKMTTQLPFTHQRPAPAPPSKLDIPPPPPSKDAKYGLPASPAATRSSATTTDINTSSPTQPQLWRRRSVKSERALELPDLKLVNSHGSTAASASQTVAKPVAQAPTVIQPVAKPVVQSTQPHLPSGVIKVSALTYQQPKLNKPDAASTKNAQTLQAPALAVVPASAPASDKAFEADSPTMGSGSSKLNKLKDKLQTLHRRGKSSVDVSSESLTRPGVHRPPTPEYQKQDVKTPIVDSFVSPLSPASSPEPLAEVSPNVSKELPKHPYQEQTLQQPAQAPSQLRSPNGLPTDPYPIARKAVALPTQGANHTKPLPEPKELPEQKGIPEPATLPSPNDGIKPFTEQKLEVVTETESLVTEPAPSAPSTTQVASRPPSTDSHTSRAHQSSEVPTKFPPRGSSVRSNATRPIENARYIPEDQDPRLVPSESQGYLYRGRDGTLYPEMKVTQEPDPQATYFPFQTDEFLPDGTIFKAVPLKDSHLNCYQGHRTMNRRTNRNYPLTCQTCEKPDAEDRWVCTFCHLRICESCFTTLNGHQRDLRQLVKESSPYVAAA